MKRRSFIKGVAASVSGAALLRIPGMAQNAKREGSAARSARPLPVILNQYTALLPGEAEALAAKISVHRIEMEYQLVEASFAGESKKLKVGDSVYGWKLLAILPWHNGTPTAVFEKHVTHQGVLVFVTAERELARIPKQIGDLSQIKPREVLQSSPVKFERPAKISNGPDTLGQYILNSDQDPSYENLAGLGKEYTGWTLVSDDGVGALKSIWLEPDGKSRQTSDDPQASWAPDTNGRLFEPFRLLSLPYLYALKPGYSKRTMLGGFLPAADIGVWNPDNGVGYEVMMVLSDSGDRRPIGRIRATLHPTETGAFHSADRVSEPLVSDGVVDRYWNGSANEFFTAVLSLWERWTNFFDTRMKVEIPDAWLLQAAKAGIVLSRCSYRGLEPTYQIGEGAYTKIPERSHALFPVAHYEFVWAQQLWNQVDRVEPHFQHYLEKYVLPDGNFMYNVQDQVEAPVNVGVFLQNSARAYDYCGDFEALQRRLPVLQRMIDYVLARRAYTKAAFPPSDPRHGLIWGSPEADNGDPDDDNPDSHLYYYQNAAWIWRGLKEHGRCLQKAGSEHGDQAMAGAGLRFAKEAEELRADVESALKKTLNARNEDLKRAGITPFSAFDTTRRPEQLSSYENHRYMMDWWTSDWGDADLDEGHFRHRTIAGQEVLGMNQAADGIYAVDSGTLATSNFMEHGTLAARIRKDDYRPFLLTLYANLTFAMDNGSRFAPEDALFPGGSAGEGAAWMWSPVVNSTLQPTLALRWILCYEENDNARVHLQKAAPKSWFAANQRIAVENCPTRFGQITWATQAVSAGAGWDVTIALPAGQPFAADIIVHFHPASGRNLRSTSYGSLQGNTVVLSKALLAEKTVHVLHVE
jgi:hypothetical protein